MVKRIRSAFAHAVEITGQAILKAARFLAGIGPRFWFFTLGLVLVAIGAWRIAPSLSLLLTGFLLIWDASRQPQAPTRPPGPFR
jgi:hypothetical protein